MATYKVTHKDGREFELEGPAGASEQEVISALQSKLQREDIDKERADYEAQLAERTKGLTFGEEPEGDSTLIGNILKGIPLGAIELWETAALGSATALGEEAETSIRENIRKTAAPLKKAFELENEQEWSAQFGRGLGSLAAFLPAAFLGPAALPAAAALAIGAGAGEASERARTAGATPRQRTVAARWGTIPGSFDVIPLARLSKKFGTPFINRIVDRFGPEEVTGWGSRLKRAAVTGTIEGAQEIAQGIAQNIIEKTGYRPEAGILIPEEQAGEGLLGFSVGAVAQGLMDAFVGRKGRKGEGGEPEQGELFPEDTDLGAPPGPTPYVGGTGPTIGAAEQLAAGRAEEARRQVTEEEAEYANQRTRQEHETRQDELNKLTDREQQTEAARIFYSNVEQYRQTRAAEQPDLFPVSPEVAAAARTDEGRQPDLFEALDTPAASQREAELTPEQLDLFPPEEQRVQAAAREREGLRAAERDDVAAFEQPDLFALEQEQERRRLGTLPVDQFMDTATQEEIATEVRRRRVREKLGREPTAEEVASERAIDDPAWAIEREAAAVREPRQLGIEDEIAFQQELEAEETARAAEAPPVPIPDTRRERVAAREAQDIARGEQTRGELPGLGRVATRAEAPAPALPVTAATLAGIPKSIPTYKQLTKLGKEGRDTSDPEVRKILEAHEEKINIRKPSKKNTKQLETVQNLLRGSVLPKPETTTDETGTEQLTLFDTTLPDTGLKTRRGRGRVRSPVPTGRRTGVGTPKGTPETAPAGLGRLTAIAAGITPREAEPTRTLTEEKRLTAPEITKKAAAKKVVVKKKKVAAKKVAAKETRKRTAPETTKEKTVTAKIRADRSKAKTADQNIEVEILPAGKARGSQDITGRSSAPIRARYRRLIGKVNPKTEEAYKKAREEAQATEDVPKGLESFRKEDPEGFKRLVAADFGKGTLADEWAWYQTETSYGGNVPLLEQFPNLNVSDADALKIVALLEGSPQTNDIAYDAKIYFGKYRAMRDNVLLAIHDSVNSPDINTPSADEDVRILLFMHRTGRSRADKALEWMRKNLSDETNEWISIVRDNQVTHKQANKRTVDENDLVVNVTTIGQAPITPARAAAIQQHEIDVEEFLDARSEEQIARDALANAKSVEAREKAAAAKEAAAKKAAAKRAEVKRKEAATDKKAASTTKKLAGDAVVSLDAPLHPTVRLLLREGNLQGAIGALSRTSNNSTLSKLANVLSESLELSNTKVEVVNNLKDEAGVHVAGLFNPKTNTIQLDSKLGMNSHSAIHETTHALTSHILANKSHPLTKQLDKLFNDTKEELDTAYGAQSLDEFVAEAFSNVEFQQKLAGINPKGSSVSSLQRFFYAVANMLRRLVGISTRPIPLGFQKFNTVHDKTDALIHAMLSPAPNSRNAGSMYMSSTSEHIDTLLKNVATMGKSFPKPTPEYRQKFAGNFVSFIKGDSVIPKMKDWMTQIMPMQALTDVAAYLKIPSAFELHRTIERMIGEQGKVEKSLDATLQLISGKEGWITTHPEMKKTFDDVVYTSTRFQVNPSEPRSKYLDKDGKPTKKSETWDKLKPKWDKLKRTGGDKVYLRMLNTYKKQFETLKAVIADRINTMKDSDGNLINKTEREKLQTNIYEKLFQKGRIDPYFPLTRKGEFWLEFQGVDSLTGQPEMVYMSFENTTARKNYVKQIKTFPEVDNKTIRKFEKLKTAEDYARAPATSFMSKTLQILRANKVSGDVQMEFMNLFLNALPESSFAKALTRRANEGMGRPGYLEDAVLAFRTKAYDLSSATVRLQWGAKINAVEQQLEKEYNELTRGKKADPDKEYASARIVVDELRKRAEFARNPPSDARAALANRLAFMGTIGWNVSSAVVNASQVPLFMQPILGGKYGQGKAASALINAGRLIKASGRDREISTLVGDETVNVKGAFSIDNFFVEDSANEGKLKVREDMLKKLPPKIQAQIRELQPLIQIAMDRGQLNRSLFYDTLNIQMAGREKGVWDWLSASSAWMFHHVERGNRQVALISTYQLEIDRLKEKHGKNLTQEQKDAAANLAVYTAQEINGGAFLATAPSLAQSGLGRVAMMYKTYGIQMYYTIMKTGRTFFMKDLPAHWVKEGYAVGTAKAMGDVAFKQFIGVMVSNVALAGVQGLPFIGIIMALSNMFLPEDGEDSETILRKVVGEGWWKGGLVYGSELVGVGTDVATRIGMGNLIFRMNPYARNDSLEMILAQAAGGPAWSVGKQFASGAKRAFFEGEPWRGTESMLPSAARNLMKTWRYSPWGDDGIRTQRYDPIYEDVTTGNLIMQGLGFPPSEYTRRLEENLVKKKISRDIVDQRTDLLRKYWVAVSRSDYDGARELAAKMRVFSKKHPYKGVVITGKTVTDSMRSHAKATSAMHHGVQIPKGLRGLLKEDYFNRSPVYDWWSDEPEWSS